MNYKTTVDRVIGLVLGLAGFAVYTTTLASGAYPGQSALLVVERTGLYPVLTPNNPLWRFVAHISTQWIPIGDAATRLNLLSALFGAICIWLVYDLMVRVVFGSIDTDVVSETRVRIAARLAAVSSSVFLMFAIPFWVVSTRAHTEAFDLMLLLAAAKLLLGYAVNGKFRTALLFSFLYGIGIVEFATFITFAPFFGLVLLYVMWRQETLRLSSALSLVGCAVLGLLLYIPVAWQFYGSSGYVLREYGNFFDVIWFMWRDQYFIITRSLPREGWLIILFMTVIPWLACLAVARRALNNERDWGFYLLHIVVTVLVVTVLLNAEFSPWGMMGYGRLLVTPYLLTASVFGYLIAYWFMLPAQWGTEETASAVFFRQWLGVLLVLPLLGLLAWAPFRNVDSSDGRPSCVINAMAKEIVQSLDGRTWLVTDGPLDDHLLVAAHNMNLPLKLININKGRSSVYCSYLEGLFESPRMKNLVRVGISNLLLEWMKTDPDVCKKLAVLNKPDLWVAAGLTAVPSRLLFLGSKNSSEIDSANLLSNHHEFWERFKSISEYPFEEGAPLERWWREFLRHTGMVANNLGVYFEDLGRSEDAFAAYRASREIDPENVSALLNMWGMVDNGLASDEDGSIKAAIGVLEKEQTQKFHIWSLSQYYGYVRLPEAFAQLGWTWAYSGQPGLGLEGLKKAKTLLPEDRQGRIKQLMAGIYLSQKQELKSAKIYADILKNDPKNRTALVGMYRIASRQGDFETALKFLVKAEVAGVAKSVIGFEKAAVHFLDGKSEQAKEELNELLMDNPKSIRGWRLLAEVLMDLKNQSALDRCLRRLEENEGYGGYNVSLIRGRIALKNNDIETAYEHFEKALVRQPGNTMLLEWFVNTDMRYRKMGAARKHVKALLRRKPDSPIGHYVLGSLQIADGDLLLAEDSLRQSLSFRESDAAHNDLAWLLRNRGDLQNADKHAREAVKLNPRSGAAWDTLGAILYDRKQYKKAASAYEKALAHRQTPVIYLHMLECQLKLENKERASEIVEMLLPQREMMSPEDRDKLLKLQRIIADGQ